MKTIKAREHPWRTLFLLAAIFLPTHAGAQEVPGYPTDVHAYDPREVAMLPRYCIYTQLFRDRVPGGNDATEIQRWRSVMGEPFQAMHHYCWGLMKTNRSVLLARDRTVKKFYLEDSLGEFDYVIRHSRDDFILLPEIHTKKGENLIRLGRGAAAVREFERAAELKPDYWPPYAHMGDYYREAGDLDKARDVLKKGLQLAPDAVGLRRRLSELSQSKSLNKSARQ